MASASVLASTLSLCCFDFYQAGDRLPDVFGNELLAVVDSDLLHQALHLLTEWSELLLRLLRKIHLHLGPEPLGLQQL